MNSRKVVITGLGVLSACGSGWKPFWEAALAGQSCIRPLNRLSFEKFHFKRGGEVPDFDPKKYVQNRKSIKLMSRDIQLAVGAAKLAFEDAGITPSGFDLSRMGVVIGSGVINNELEELAPGYLKAVEADGNYSLKKFGAEGVPALQPLWMLKYLPNMPASHVTIEFGLRGYSNTVTFSAASGAQAIGEAARVIERGDADVMLAGGADSKLNPMGLSRFELFNMLSQKGEQKPFDESADGFVPGEGAGILVLESLEHAQKRGARIYAEFAGFSSAPDSNVDPRCHADGSGKEAAMRNALRDAGLSSVDLVIANGSGLPEHDKREAEALKKCLPQAKVSALKNITGHTVYAAGGIESAAAVLALSENKMPPAAGVISSGLDFVRHAAEMQVQSVMLNAFGFCGQNTSIVFRKAAV